MHINDELLRAAKRRAAERGTSLKAVFEEALRTLLGSEKPATPYKLRWRTERGRILPGVNLADRKSLMDLMDGIE